MNRRVGRPAKFSDVELISQKIERYFDSCNDDNEPISITGLALSLDTTRELLAEYERKPQFSATIKRAKARVEHAYEKRLIKQGRSGDIFALKNFGWHDRQEVESSGKIEHDVSIRGLSETADFLSGVKTKRG